MPKNVLFLKKSYGSDPVSATELMNYIGKVTEKMIICSRQGS